MRRRLAAALAALFMAVRPAASGTQPAPPPEGAPQAQPADERPLDARTYAQGIEAIRQGKRDEASRILKRMYHVFPDSPYAPQAVFKVAEMIYPVGALDQVGSASPAAIKEAADLLAMLSQRYRSSREAPRALVKLGYLALEPANPAGGLDEACARFASAAQVYPDSDAADDAYFGSGMCESLRARPARAADFYARLLDENPTSPLAAEALYRFGLALSHLGDPAEAMLALQQVRARHPDSRFAPRALDRITLLHRLRLAPSLASPSPPGSQGAAPLYRVDEDYGAVPRGRAPAARARTARAEGGGADQAPGFSGATDIVIDAQGLAVLASPRSPAVVRLDARGRVQERIAHPGPEYVAAGEGLAVYISGRGQIALNARNWSGADLRGADGRPPREFGPIAVDAAGRVHLLDTRDNALLVFDRSRRLIRALRPGTREGRFVDLASSEDGGVYVLEGRTQVVLELHQGRETRRVSLAGLGLAEPIALAVDGLGDLFLLDGKTGWVHVADPAGRRITLIRTPKEVLSRLGDVSSIAVDAVGRVYLCGRKGSRVVRFL
ncbi:MAG: tetratricopeptide repeat protein [Acidobacteria bacterium]|nr:tetratricopeptide repeat protein [Acidobacteriota bacterium]